MTADSKVGSWPWSSDTCIQLRDDKNEPSYSQTGIYVLSSAQTHYLLSRFIIDLTCARMRSDAALYNYPSCRCTRFCRVVPVVIVRFPVDHYKQECVYTSYLLAILCSHKGKLLAPMISLLLAGTSTLGKACFLSL